MKHLFIPYELAVIAKEKGFNEPCLGYFDKRDKDFVMWDDVVSILECSNSYFNEIQISAPLYQQIVDWFRDKGVHFKVERWGIVIKSKYSDISIRDQRVVTTKEYYEALNKATEEAFKLI